MELYLIQSEPRLHQQRTEKYLQKQKKQNSIPDIFQNLACLNILELDNNQLSGTVPISMANLPLLSRLLLMNNKLSGNLDKSFNGSFQKQLNNIQLSHT